MCQKGQVGSDPSPSGAGRRGLDWRCNLEAFGPSAVAPSCGKDCAHLAKGYGKRARGGGHRGAPTRGLKQGIFCFYN